MYYSQDEEQITSTRPIHGKRWWHGMKILHYFFHKEKKPVAHVNHNCCKKIIKKIIKGKVTKKTTFKNEAHIKSALPALQLTC